MEVVALTATPVRATSFDMPMNVFGIALLVGMVVPSLPPCEFADTEVSTNIPVAVNLESTSRLEFSLSLDASPTNAVRIGIFFLAANINVRCRLVIEDCRSE